VEELEGDNLINQLNVLIKDCQVQADTFLENGMVMSEKTSLAMKVAYMNVKTMIDTSTCTESNQKGN